MCGRFVIKDDNPRNIQKYIEGVRLPTKLEPNFNTAPTQNILGISASETGPYGQYYRWGLIPSWAKDPSIGTKMINARVETLSEKASFSNLLKTRRCLIPASGFYEWRIENGKKQPYYIHYSDQVVFFLGLWDYWKKEDSSIFSCTIITTQSEAWMQQYHSRKPYATVDKEVIDTWLNPKIENIFPFILESNRYPENMMKAFRVSKAINSVSFNSQEALLEMPLDLPKSRIGSLFFWD